MTPEIATVQAWQAAANAQDSERLLALSDPEIVIIGPRGRATGHAVLQAWLARAGLTLTTQRLFQRGDTVVADQHGQWQSAATGGVASHAELASRFRVREQRVYEYERYESLAAALQASGLTTADQQSRPNA